MKINALVVGASKGLGKEVLLLHRDLKHSVIGISRSGKNNTIILDVTNTNELNKFLNNNTFDFITYTCMDMSRTDSVRNLFDIMFHPLCSIVEHQISIQQPTKFLTFGSLALTAFRDVKMLPPAYYASKAAVDTYFKYITNRYKFIQHINICTDIVNTPGSANIFGDQFTKKSISSDTIRKFVHIALDDKNISGMTIVS